MGSVTVVRGELRVEDIARAAHGIAAGEGLAAVSMRRVATEVGVWPTALYHHVGDKDGLVRLVLDAVLGELRVPAEDLPWDAWLRAFAVGVREVLLRHPGVAAHLADHGNYSPTALRLVDTAIGVLRRAGFGDRDAAVLFVDLFGFVTSRVRREEVLARAGGTHFPVPPAPLTDLAAVLPHWRALSPEEYLLDGVDLLIDGAAVRLHRG